MRRRGAPGNDAFGSRRAARTARARTGDLMDSGSSRWWSNRERSRGFDAKSSPSLARERDSGGLWVELNVAPVDAEMTASASLWMVVICLVLVASSVCGLWNVIVLVFVREFWRSFGRACEGELDGLPRAQEPRREDRRQERSAKRYQGHRPPGIGAAAEAQKYAKCDVVHVHAMWRAP